MSLTPTEEEVLSRLAGVWNVFLLLPPAHPDETADMRAAVHAIQYIIGTRVARRADPHIWVGTESPLTSSP